MQGVANAAYLEGVPFSGLPCVAPYCAPGGVKVVSRSAQPLTGSSSLSEYSAYLWAKERADERTRTADLLITSELLYLLSYVGLVERVYRSRIVLSQPELNARRRI